MSSSSTIFLSRRLRTTTLHFAAVCVGMCAFAYAACAIAAKPIATIPTDPATVIERLPSGFAEATRRSPRSEPVAQRAMRLLTLASRSGDARLAARAEAMLLASPVSNAPDVLRARAFAAQHRHGFSEAVRLLDRLIAIDPRDADARLFRAQILLVQGRLDLARGDCVALAIGLDAGRGALCAAALRLRYGDAAQAASLLDAWLERGAGAAASVEPALLRYALRMRAEAAAFGRFEDADRHYQRARRAAPDDLRTALGFAAHLRQSGRAAEALRLLAEMPRTDAVLLQQALAARAVGSAQAPSLIARLERRYRDAHRLGAEPELREEAEFQLVLKNDARTALTLALRNFSTQRDEEDVALLRRAAAAAGRPDALRDLRDWASRHRLVLSPLPGEQG